MLFELEVSVSHRWKILMPTVLGCGLGAVQVECRVEQIFGSKAVNK